MNRRSFLGGLAASALSAPAIVSIANIMPVKWSDPLFENLRLGDLPIHLDAGMIESPYVDMTALMQATRRGLFPHIFQQLWQSPPMLAIILEDNDGS